MDNCEIELVGSPCGQHGPYTFYKAFKYSKNGSQRIISLCEFFFVKLWSDSDLVCIGELQLLWVDKNSEQMLASLRLYFLPENTPEGRMDHGEDEVLAITEKVVLRLEDLLTWITVDTEWTWGRSVLWDKDVDEPIKTEDETSLEKATLLTDSTLDFTEIEKEKKLIEETDPLSTDPPKHSLIRSAVIVLSYPRYCRYRSLMKRLEGVESRWLRHSLVVALGGFAAPGRNTRVLFCKDTFDYPDLEGHELLCNHLAPKLKGRPRGKRKKRSISPGGSESNESEASVTVGTTASTKTRLTTAGGRNGLRCNSTTSPRRSTRSTENVEERDFLNKLHVYMKSHRTPIGRVPSIGYKEIDLFQLYKKVQRFGGYDKCTSNRMWKQIFDDLGGHHNSTSAATIIKRHYERLLLPYERHIRGEEYKPLPISERRRLKSKTASFSDAETSENDRSSSGKSTPVPSTTPTAATPTTPSTPTDFKEFSIPEKAKTEGKTSSLRSVRVKPDRLRDVQQKEQGRPANTTSPTSIIPTTSSLPEKNPSNIPVTSAVAPVVEKTVPEKSASPLEGKENIPVMMIPETTLEQTRTESEDDVIEVPYKPKTPEIIELDDDPEPSLTITSSKSSGVLYDVKKRKLDILKEGGLEVTAITGYSEPVKDGRPSVIQHSVPQISPKSSEIGNLSITVTTDSKKMPPPIRFQNPKKSNIFLSRSLASSGGTEHTQTRLPPAVDVRLVPGKMNTSPLTVPSGATSPVVNGNTPPKVLQSRSIYSYSERTVYGNPKDTFMPPPHTPQVPRHLLRSPSRQTGGEVLDLTIKSPQKPIVEIMRIPNVSISARSSNNNNTVKDLSSKSTYLKGNSSTGMPLLDARVGSNLEITLVSGTGSKKDSRNSHSNPKISLGNSSSSNLHNNNNYSKSSQKRSSSGRFINLNSNKNSIENHHKNGSANLVIPHPHGYPSNGRSNETSKLESSAQKSSAALAAASMAASPFLTATSPFMPGYISQLAAAASKGATPYLPVIDPLYYSALAQAQGLYPPSASHMFPPMSTVDQLQLYKDLMAHSARGRFPFPLPPEGSNSLAVSASNDNPNLLKK